MVGWGLAAALGAVAGALVAPQLTLTPGMLDTALVYALAAVILGGLSSPIGVVVAAWIDRRAGEPGRGVRRRSSAST